MWHKRRHSRFLHTWNVFVHLHASDSNANEASIEIIIKIVELGKMNTTITVGPYYSLDSANVAAENYLKEGSNARAAIEAGLAQTLVESGADLSNFRCFGCQYRNYAIVENLRGQFISPVRFLFRPQKCRLMMRKDDVDAPASCWKKKVMPPRLTVHYPQSEASLTTAASSGTLGSSLEAASSAAGVESVPVSPEVTTTKVAVTKTVDLEASKLAAVKATVESISARLSVLSTSVRRVQNNIDNDIDFEGYLTFNEKAWDASMEASLEEHAELTAYASEAFRLLNATVSVQESNNEALITLQERASELKIALESTLETLNAMNSGEDGSSGEALCEKTNSCACPKRDKGEILVYFNATNTFTYIPDDFPACIPPPPPPPSPPPSPPPVPLGCTPEYIMAHGGCKLQRTEIERSSNLERLEVL